MAITAPANWPIVVMRAMTESVRAACSIAGISPMPNALSPVETSTITAPHIVFETIQLFNPLNILLSLQSSYRLSGDFLAYNMARFVRSPKSDEYSYQN